jgi:hypothetical protein
VNFGLTVSNVPIRFDGGSVISVVFNFVIYVRICLQFPIRLRTIMNVYLFRPSGYVRVKQQAAGSGDVFTYVCSSVAGAKCARSLASFEKKSIKRFKPRCTAEHPGSFVGAVDP